MVNIDKSQMANSKSITNAIFDSYYPNGKIVVENTSYGKNGVSGRTLTSRTISEAISGDVLYRSPRFASTFYNKSIGSSLNSLITAGSESTFDSTSTLVIEDPESGTYTDADGVTKTAKLRGGAAFARILAESIVGKQGGSSFIQEAEGNLYDNYVSFDTESREDGKEDHGDTPDNIDTGNPSAGGRMVMLTNNSTVEERAWHAERALLLANIGYAGSSSHLKTGWNFDIPNGLRDLGTKDGGTEFPLVDPGSNIITVPVAIIDAAPQTAYICPAIIEFFILLSTKIKFSGGFGASRWSDDRTTNSMTEGNTLSAHGFGRAFDLMNGTSLSGTFYDLESLNLETFRGFMDMFLTAINSFPMHLIPDLLGFDDRLKTEYGVSEDKDADDAAIKLRFPNLKHVRWYPDSGHRNHLHIAFSPARSGIYTGAGGAFTTGPVTPPATGAGSTIDLGFGVGVTPGNIFDSKYTKSYKVPNTGELSQDEIFQLLTGTIAHPELAALFTAITVREGNVGSWNPVYYPGKDYSFGCFQINLLAHGNKTFLTPLPTVLSTEGWKLAASAWEYFGLTNFEQWKSFTISIAKSEANNKTAAYKADTRNSTSDRLWIPINQAFMLYTTCTNRTPVYPLPADQKLGFVPEMQHVLQPWGDYGGGPANGPISNVKWSDVVGVYLRNTNQTEETLKTWVRRYFAFAGNGATSRSAPVIEEWMNGEMFGS